MELVLNTAIQYANNWNLQCLYPFEEIEAKSDQKKSTYIRVLLVEDDEDCRTVLSHMLENIGMEVTQAESGGSAIERYMVATASGADFDLVLMDLQMPRLDGFKASSMLRECGYKGHIIAITANPTLGKRTESLMKGCDAFLPKASLSELLLPTLDRLH